MEAGSIYELSKEYSTRLRNGRAMGGGTRTYRKLIRKYACGPATLWNHLSLKEKIILWSVEHGTVGDGDAEKMIRVISL